MNEEALHKKLDTIIALLATQGKDEEGQVEILKNLGMTYKEISNLTNIPAGTLKSRDHKKRKGK